MDDQPYQISWVSTRDKQQIIEGANPREARTEVASLSNSGRNLHEAGTSRRQQRCKWEITVVEDQQDTAVILMHFWTRVDAVEDLVNYLIE